MATEESLRNTNNKYIKISEDNKTKQREAEVKQFMNKLDSAVKTTYNSLGDTVQLHDPYKKDKQNEYTEGSHRCNAMKEYVTQNKNKYPVRMEYGNTIHGCYCEFNWSKKGWFW